MSVVMRRHKWGCPQLLGLVCFLVSCGTLAHPHNWIALDSTFVLNENAQLVSIEQTWEFDVFYSMLTLADVLNTYPNEEIGLPATAAEMIRNLRAYDYFSSLRVDEQDVSLPMPSQYALSTVPKDGKTVLRLTMRFDFEQGINIENRAVAWQVFDPTYYIAMNHATRANIRIEGGNATECSTRLAFPEPSEELIDYALSLDRSRRDTEGLGEYFAETAYITCI